MSDEVPLPEGAGDGLVLDLFRSSGRLLRPVGVSLRDELAKDRPDWEAIYRHLPVDRLPWVSPGLDRDVAAWLDEVGHRPAARILDLGTGAGTQALGLARRGLEVVGVDVSPSAIAVARERADRAGVSVDFRVVDFLADGLEGGFELILDRGCLHGLPRAAWPDYVDTVAGALEAGGRLLLKCLGEKEPRDIGPHRFAAAELRATFGSRFVVEAMRETRFEGAGPDTDAPLALFCALRLGSI